MRKTLVFLALIAFAAALPASEKTSASTTAPSSGKASASKKMPAKDLAQIDIVKPIPGMAGQWVEGLKKLNEWKHQHNLPFASFCWLIISGPRTGQYALGTFDHAWKDFDAAEKAGRGGWKEIQTDLVPYTDSVTQSFWTYREDLSGPPGKSGQPPEEFSAITTFVLKVGGSHNVTKAIYSGNAAIAKSHWEGNGKFVGWYSLVNGGYQDQLALVIAYKDFAGFEPPEISFEKMMKGVYGKDGANAIFAKFNNSVKGVHTEIWRYQPDLSYIPSSQ